MLLAGTCLMLLTKLPLLLPMSCILVGLLFFYLTHFAMAKKSCCFKSKKTGRLSLAATDYKKIIHWVVATELKMTEWKTVYREYKYSTARLAQV